MLTYKVQLYQTKNQQVILSGQLEKCRRLYNRLLEELNTAREEGIKTSMYQGHVFITYLKNNSMPELKEVYSKVLQMVNQTLWGSIKALAQLKKKGRKIGKLRFKGKGWYKTLNFNQSGFRIDEQKNLITFSRIGAINCRGLNNRIRENKVKGIIIKRTQLDKWFAHIQVENISVTCSTPTDPKSVGIDVGVKAYAVDSDGREIENPKNITKQMKRLRQKHRSLSRKKKGSKNYVKAKYQLVKLYNKVVDQRKDFLHKLSRFYVKNYDVICVEDLNINGLTQKGSKKHQRSRTLHRNILDASWGQFFSYLEYKAVNADKQMVKVNPKHTTQECSKCGELVLKTLSDRRHICPYCGLDVDRDYNASINILKRGTGRTSLLVENRPLSTILASAIISGQVFSMNQETPSFR